MTSIQSWHEAEAALTEQWPGFSVRPQQRRMAEAVQLTVRGEAKHRVLLAQAGCGVGKSLGYLIPIIAQALRVRKRVVVSVSTKALQDQIAGKDLPTLRDTLFPELTFAVLKGRSNYVCLREADKNGGAYVKEGTDGERQDLVQPVDDREWRELTTDAEGCIGRKRCPFGRECYSERAKSRALRATVLVVNTSLLTQDLRLRAMTNGAAGILGEYDYLVVDEAHEMPSIVADGLTVSVTLGRILNTCSRIEGHYPDAAQKAVDELRDRAATWFGRLQRFFEDNPKSRTAELDVDDQAEAARLTDLLRTIDTAAQDADCRCEDPEPDEDGEIDRVCEFARRVDGLTADMSGFSRNTDHGGVTWMEAGRGGRVEMKIAPVEVGGFLHAAVWELGKPTVLTSATLGINGDVTYVARRAGLSKYDSLDVGTPFDYSKQARLMLPPSDAPMPRDPHWRGWAQDQMYDLVLVSGGGALLLFTSTSAMREAHDALRPRLGRHGLPVFLQGAGTPNRELARQFADHADSVLFATRSFFTGVDFAGDTCRLVVIDKMPFPVPDDPVFKARCALTVKRFGKGSDFRRVSIPEMSLVLIQAFGRLIRSVDDAGAVAILDPRMRAGWASAVRRALPPAPLVSSVDEVAAFFAGLRSARGAD